MDQKTNVIKISIVVILVSILTACHLFSSPEKVQQKRTTAAATNIQLGMVYLKKNETARAKQKFLLALHEAPQQPESWNSLAYFFEVTGDPVRAQRCHLRARNLAKLEEKA